MTAKKSTNKYKSLFEYSPIATWEEDFSAVGDLYKRIKKEKVKHVRKYLTDNKQLVAQAFRAIRSVDANQAALKLYRAKNKKELFKSLGGSVTFGAIDHLMDMFTVLLERRGSYRVELRNRDARGELIDLLLKISVPAASQETLKCVIVTLENITSQKRLERHLKRIAQLDSLTKVLNHRTISERLDHELIRARRYKLSLACMMVDIDYFKEVNDFYGHLKGDQILKKVAKLFTESIRKVDVIGRYGGDEFLIILPETSSVQGHLAATRLQDTYRKHIHTGRGVISKTSLSIGISGFPSEDIKENFIPIRLLRF